MNINKNNTSFQVQEQKALLGVDKYFSNVASVTIGGVQYTPAALKKVLSDDLGAQAVLGPQRAQLRVSVQAARKTRVSAHALLKALRVHIGDQYGSNAAPVLEDFGYPLPAATTKATVKDKAQTVDKQLATRAARHTMGKKEKSRIKGAPPAEAASVPATPPSPSK